MTVRFSKNIFASVFLYAMSSLFDFSGKVYAQSSSGFFGQAHVPSGFRFSGKVYAQESSGSHLPLTTMLTKVLYDASTSPTRKLLQFICQWVEGRATGESFPLPADSDPEYYIKTIENTDPAKKRKFTVWGSLSIPGSFMIKGHELQGSTTEPEDVLSLLNRAEDVVAVDDSMWRKCGDHPELYCLVHPDLPPGEVNTSRDSHPSILPELKIHPEAEKNSTVLITLINGAFVREVVVGCGVGMVAQFPLGGFYVRKCAGGNTSGSTSPNESPTSESQDSSTDSSKKGKKDEKRKTRKSNDAAIPA